MFAIAAASIIARRCNVGVPSWYRNNDIGDRRFQLRRGDVSQFAKVHCRELGESILDLLEPVGHLFHRELAAIARTMLDSIPQFQQFH